jgi:hypothetical protein
MTATIARRDHYPATHKGLPHIPLQKLRCEALDKSTIADASAASIDHMTCDELVRMILAAQLPTLCRPDLDRRLRFYDRETLKRLAHVARRCSQNRLEPSCDGSLGTLQDS